MNKTLNLQSKVDKSPFSLADQHSRGVPTARVKVEDRSRIQVCVETSTAERHAGINVSYENSITAIKKDLLREIPGADRKTKGLLPKGELIPIEEKPNKPKEKPIVKNMHSGKPDLNLTQEFKGPSTSITPSTIQVDDHLSRTAAQYASHRSNGESYKAHQPPASSLGIYDNKNSTMTGAPLQHLFATSTLDTPQLFSSTIGAPAAEEEYATFNETILK